jgi:phosphatidylserine/phosphatidylglycerophosphate/cardiolipin synthase-like enzyme
MLHQSLTIDILADKIIAGLSGEADSSSLVRLIKTDLPSLSDADAVKVCQLANALISPREEESVEIVATTPISFRTKTRKTRPVVEELFVNAKKSVMLTGYSISEHFEEFIRLIDMKSKQGVVVEMFVNNYDSVKSVLADVKHTRRRYLKVYGYTGKVDDKMAALHAKTIVIDGEKILISSANLSYHGLEGNIEIGALITSKKKAAQVLDIFADLKRQKVFILVED